MQCRFSTHRGRIRVGAMLDEIDDNIHVSHKGSHVKRGEPRLGGGLDRSTVLEEQLYHFDAVLLAGDV